jgi:hypothetical protein
MDFAITHHRGSAAAVRIGRGNDAWLLLAAVWSD